jgi:hypothetical protein
MEGLKGADAASRPEVMPEVTARIVDQERTAPRADGAAAVERALASALARAADADSFDVVMGGGNAPARVELAPPESVEHALARALSRAADAGRWEIVAQLARELEARRLGDTGASR